MTLSTKCGGAEADRDEKRRDEQRCAEEVGHGELLKRLQVDEGPDGLDVDRCAENAAQREDEDRHAALLITWRYAW